MDESHNVRQGFLTFEAYEKILPLAPASIRPLFVCAFHVSSRKGEIKSVLWSQVDLKDGLIVLDPSDTKNKTGRALPIYGDMVKALRDQKALRDRDFPERHTVFFWHRDRPCGLEFHDGETARYAGRTFCEDMENRSRGSRLCACSSARFLRSFLIE